MRRLIPLLFALALAGAARAQPYPPGLQQQYQQQGELQYVYEREACVRRIGESARIFIRVYGDRGFRAIQNLHPETARRLIACDKLGDMPPAGRDRLFEAIARTADTKVVMYVISHLDELAVPGNLAAFCREDNTRAVSYGFKSLEQAAAEGGTSSFPEIDPTAVTGASGPWPVALPGENDWSYYASVILIGFSIFAVAYGLWRKYGPKKVVER